MNLLSEDYFEKSNNFGSADLSRLHFGERCFTIDSVDLTIHAFAFFQMPQ